MRLINLKKNTKKILYFRSDGEDEDQQCICELTWKSRKNKPRGEAKVKEKENEALEPNI